MGALLMSYPQGLVQVLPRANHVTRPAAQVQRLWLSPCAATSCAPEPSLQNLDSQARHLAKRDVACDKQVIGSQLKAARRLEGIRSLQCCSGSDFSGWLDDLSAQLDLHDVTAPKEGIKGFQDL